MNQTRGIAPIIIILIIALLAGGGTYYAQKKGIVNVPILRKVIKQAQKVEENKTQQPSEDAATKNWKTYRNEKYGFEFKYPVSVLGTPSVKEDHKGYVRIILPNL